MICVDFFSKYSAVVCKNKGHPAGKIAHGLMECIAKAGGPAKVIMTYGEGGRLFLQQSTEHNRSYIPLEVHPVFAEMLIRSSFFAML